MRGINVIIIILIILIISIMEIDLGAYNFSYSKV